MASKWVSVHTRILAIGRLPSVSGQGSRGTHAVRTHGHRMRRARLRPVSSGMQRVPAIADLSFFHAFAVCPMLLPRKGAQTFPDNGLHWRWGHQSGGEFL